MKKFSSLQKYRRPMAGLAMLLCMASLAYGQAYAPTGNISDGTSPLVDLFWRFYKGWLPPIGMVGLLGAFAASQFLSNGRRVAGNIIFYLICGLMVPTFVGILIITFGVK